MVSVADRGRSVDIVGGVKKKSNGFGGIGVYSTGEKGLRL